MKKTFIISAGTFPYDIMFHFGTEKQMKREMLKYYTKKEDLEDINRFLDRSYKASYVMLQDNKSFIHFPNWTGSTQDYGMLVHEIMHAVFAILDRTGVEYFRGADDSNKAGSEEVFTYLLQHLTTHTFHQIKELGI